MLTTTTTTTTTDSLRPSWIWPRKPGHVLVSILAALLVNGLLFAGVANAQRPSVDLSKAEKVVRTHLAAEKTDYNVAAAWEQANPLDASGTATGLNEGFEAEPSPLMTFAGIVDDSCDRDGSYRVLCDVAYQYADGTVDEQTLQVYVTKSGKLKLRSL
jgi:hypothetical protein